MKVLNDGMVFDHSVFLCRNFMVHLVTMISFVTFFFFIRLYIKGMILSRASIGHAFLHI